MFLAALATGCASPHFVAPGENPLKEVTFAGLAHDPRLESEAREIVRRDYWRLRELLGSTEPPKSFRIEFREIIWRPRSGPVMGYAGGDIIQLSVSMLRRRAEGMAASLRHEMTHLLQPYQEGAPHHWREGIADWAAQKLEANGGQDCRCTRDSPSYLRGYQCAAALLMYVEEQHGEGFVRALHQVLIRGEPSEVLFNNLTGKSLPALWDEFRQTDRFGADARARVALDEAIQEKDGDHDEAARLSREFFANSPGGKEITEAGDHVFALAERGELPGYHGPRPRSLVLNWDNFHTDKTYPREQEIRFPDQRQRYLYSYKLVKDSEASGWRIIKAQKINYKTGRLTRTFVE